MGELATLFVEARSLRADKLTARITILDIANEVEAYVVLLAHPNTQAGLTPETPLIALHVSGKQTHFELGQLIAVERGRPWPTPYSRDLEKHLANQEAIGATF